MEFRLKKLISNFIYSYFIMKKVILFVALCVSLSVMAEQQNGIIYVKKGATGTGSSWNDALGDIQVAITLAKAISTARKDVWVAAGEYTITTCMSMVDSVNVYGSFAGTETAVSERAKVAGSRAWEFSNPTILNGGNATRLIQSAAAFDVPTVVDGFTITNGNGTGATSGNGIGGGVLMRHNLVLQNSIVKDCAVSNGSGGGISCTGGGTIRYCLIKNNSQSTNANGGGGIYMGLNSSGGKNAFIENCVITGNTTNVRGAGIATNGVSATTTVSGCEVFNNTAYDVATSTLKPGAGIHVNQGPSAVLNCVIYNNTGANALYYAGVSNVYNNTIVKNVGGIYLSSSANFINNLVWGCATDASGATPTSVSGAVNATTVAKNNASYYPIPVDKSWDIADNIVFSSNWSNGDVENPAVGTIGSGPKFNHVSRFYGTATTPEELLQLDSVNWRLPVISPCVNMGINLTALATDIVGVPRPQGFPAETALSDIGAYELPYYKVVAGEPATANGAIYSSLGVLLAENHTEGYAKGAKIELFFQANTGYNIDRAYYTVSTDGGTTFTGSQTDITANISPDGFWTATVSAPFKVSVVWKSITALKEINTDKIKCNISENGVQVNGLIAGDNISVFNSNGMLMYQSKATSNQANIALINGVYILRVADSAKKLIIK